MINEDSRSLTAKPVLVTLIKCQNHAFIYSNPNLKRIFLNPIIPHLVICSVPESCLHHFSIEIPKSRPQIYDVNEFIHRNDHANVYLFLISPDYQSRLHNRRIVAFSGELHRAHLKNYAHGAHFVMFCCVFRTGQLNSYIPGLLHWHGGSHSIVPVPVTKLWTYG